MKYRIADAYNDNGHLYFFDEDAQALCEFFPEDEKISILAVNDKIKFESSDIFLIEGKIYITSRKTLDLLRYDINNKSLDVIFDIGNKLEHPYIYDYHMFSEGKIWSFPNSICASIYSYDLKSGLYEKDIILQNEYRKDLYIRFSSGFHNNYWGAYYKTNKFLKYDLHRGETKLFEIVNPEIQIESVCFDGEYLWMTSAINGMVFKCLENGKVVDVFNEKEECKEEIFSRLYSIGNVIIALPRFGEYIFFINKYTNETKRVYLQDTYLGIEEKSIKGSKMLKCLLYKQKLIFFGFGIEAFLLTNLDGSDACNITVTYSSGDIQRISNAILKREMRILEDNNLYLSNYLDAVKYNKIQNKNLNDLLQCICGGRVYNRICK